MAFANLEDVVFYGMEPPDLVPREQFQLQTQDQANRFFIFQRSSTP